jgi:hypothetical protein
MSFHAHKAANTPLQTSSSAANAAMKPSTSWTPTPWKVTVIESTFVEGPHGETVAVTAGEQDERNTNAAHIVRCVNEREKLLKALKQIATYNQDAFKEEARKGDTLRMLAEALGMFNRVRDMAQAVLAQAEQEGQC